MLVYTGHDNGKEFHITDSLRADSSILFLIGPYKTQLDSKMNVVIGESEQELTKSKPESSLGNFMADVLLKEADIHSDSSADFSIVNVGGIRLNSIPEGPITVGKVYELMPFDNAVVVLEIDGATTAKLFDKMAAAGGWPVAGASYEIKKDNAVNIHIQGKVFDNTKTYRLAITDYLANGGDNLDCLKGIPQKKCKIIYRDAIMEYIKAITASGNKINSQIEGRVKNALQEIIH